MPLPCLFQKSSSEETPPQGKRLRKITSAPLNSLRRLCLWITCCWPEADHDPSVYPSASVGINPRGDRLPSPDVGENPSKEECLDRTLLPLSFLLRYLCCRGKKGEVKEAAQRSQDVLSHLSGDAGEWLTQNICWSETTMFFFLFHGSSWKYQAFELWNMVKAKVKGQPKAIWIQGKNKETLSLKLVIVQRKSHDKNLLAHLWKLYHKKASGIIPILRRSPAQSISFDMCYRLNLILLFFVI